MPRFTCCIHRLPLLRRTRQCGIAALLSTCGIVRPDTMASYGLARIDDQDLMLGGLIPMVNVKSLLTQQVKGRSC